MSTPRTLTVPAVARRVTLTTPHGPLAGLDAAPPAGAPLDSTTSDGAGPDGRRPVVLVPGFTGSKEDFLELLEPLVARGHRVVTLDQRGQHESPGDDDVALYTLERYAADVVAVCRAVDPVGVHLVGHSFGGLVVQHAVLADPAVATSLTLLCTGPGALPADADRDYDTFREGLTTMGNAAVWEVMRARQVATRGPAPADVEAFLTARFHANVTSSLIAMARTLGSAPDRVDELAATGVPAHVVTGEHDDSWTLDEQRLMAERLGAPWTVLPGAGHSPNVEVPDELAAALGAFFSSVELSSVELSSDETRP